MVVLEYVSDFESGLLIGCSRDLARLPSHPSCFTNSLITWMIEAEQADPALALGRDLVTLQSALDPRRSAEASPREISPPSQGSMGL